MHVMTLADELVQSPQWARAVVVGEGSTEASVLPSQYLSKSSVHCLRQPLQRQPRYGKGDEKYDQDAYPKKRSSLGFVASSGSPPEAGLHPSEASFCARTFETLSLTELALAHRRGD